MELYNSVPVFVRIILFNIQSTSSFIKYIGILISVWIQWAHFYLFNEQNQRMAQQNRFVLESVWIFLFECEHIKALKLLYFFFPFSCNMYYSVLKSWDTWVLWCNCGKRLLLHKTIKYFTNHKYILINKKKFKITQV